MKQLHAIRLAGVLVLLVASHPTHASELSAVEAPVYPAPMHETQASQVERHLNTFDRLDFDVFSHQR